MAAKRCRMASGMTTPGTCAMRWACSKLVSTITPMRNGRARAEFFQHRQRLVVEGRLGHDVVHAVVDFLLQAGEFARHVLRFRFDAGADGEMGARVGLLAERHAAEIHPGIQAGMGQPDHRDGIQVEHRRGARIGRRHFGRIAGDEQHVVDAVGMIADQPALHAHHVQVAAGEVRDEFQRVARRRGPVEALADQMDEIAGRNQRDAARAVGEIHARRPARRRPVSAMKSDLVAR